MEAKKQLNRTYLTLEQLKENIKQSKHNWYLNNTSLAVMVMNACHEY